jgi:hypothetical protein
MKKLEEFIDENYELFSSLDCSEVEGYSKNRFDKDVIDYLKKRKDRRFDYRDICVYYMEDDWADVWVENMAA